jgi:hypothetical protein
MKLVDVIILSLSVVFLIIGIYETMKFGLGHAYAYLMLATGLFFFYTFRKKKEA